MNTKKLRLNRVQNLITENSERYLSSMVGTSQEILVEGICKSNENFVFGRTKTNKIVNVKANKKILGQFVNVHIQNSNRTSLDGVQ